MTPQTRIIPLVPEDLVACTPQHAEALMQQIARELAQLVANATHESVIDLHSLLDAPARQALRQRLGTGEVQARVHCAGLTELTETAYAGCWWQRQGAATADTIPDVHNTIESILITRLPALLAAHADDVAEAAMRLQRDLTVSPLTGGQAHG